MTDNELKLINLILGIICILGLVAFIKSAIDYKVAIDELNRVKAVECVESKKGV